MTSETCVPICLSTAYGRFTVVDRVNTYRTLVGFVMENIAAGYKSNKGSKPLNTVI